MQLLKLLLKFAKLYRKGITIQGKKLKMICRKTAEKGNTKFSTGKTKQRSPRKNMERTVLETVGRSVIKKPISALY
jgi:hypothetical protein